MPSVCVRKKIRGSAEDVFDALADHERFGELPGMKSARLIKTGTMDKNGEGAVRELITDKGQKFVEAIIEYERPRMYAYKITNGPPMLRHERGEMVVTPNGEHCDVEWTSTFEITLPLVGGFIGKVATKPLGAAFDGMLEGLRRRVERNSD